MFNLIHLYYLIAFIWIYFSYLNVFIFLKGVLDPKLHPFLYTWLFMSVFQLQTFQVPSCASKHELTSGVAIAHVLNKMWVMKERQLFMWKLIWQNMTADAEYFSFPALCFKSVSLLFLSEIRPGLLRRGSAG